MFYIVAEANHARVINDTALALNVGKLGQELGNLIKGLTQNSTKAIRSLTVTCGEGGRRQATSERGQLSIGKRPCVGRLELPKFLLDLGGNVGRLESGNTV